LGFIKAKSNTSLFTFHHNTDMVYLLLYIVLTASSTSLVQHTISALKREFAMKDLGPLHHFLRVSVQHQADGLFLTQRQFTLDISERTGMVDCKSVSMAMDTQAKLSATFEPPIANTTQFRSLAKVLQYLTFTFSTSSSRSASICMIPGSLTSP
jgi:hypothetical protein